MSQFIRGLSSWLSLVDAKHIKKTDLMNKCLRTSKRVFVSFIDKWVTRNSNAN